MTLPFWGRSRYFLSCHDALAKNVVGTREQVQLTLAALETIVEFAYEMCEQLLGVHGPIGSVVAMETYHDCGLFVCGIRKVVGFGRRRRSILSTGTTLWRGYKVKWGVCE